MSHYDSSLYSTFNLSDYCLSHARKHIAVVTCTMLHSSTFHHDENNPRGFTPPEKLLAMHRCWSMGWGVVFISGVATELLLLQSITIYLSLGKKFSVNSKGQTQSHPKKKAWDFSPCSGRMGAMFSFLLCLFHWVCFTGSSWMYIMNVYSFQPVARQVPIYL